MPQRKICAYISSVDAVLLEVQPRDKIVSKEVILGAYPPLGRGLSDLSHYCACA